MSDFDRVIDLARDEDEGYSGPPPAHHNDGLPPPAPITWTPDAPAPLAHAGPYPGLFTSAGVDDTTPASLMPADEAKQHAHEAALLARGGQFTGDAAPSWSQSHQTETPGPGIGERFQNFTDQVNDAKEMYEAEKGYPAPIAGAVATGAIAVEDLVGGIFDDSAAIVERIAWRRLQRGDAAGFKALKASSVPEGWLPSGPDDPLIVAALAPVRTCA
jgi:hypothetical protein